MIKKEVKIKMEEPNLVQEFPTESKKQIGKGF